MLLIDIPTVEAHLTMAMTLAALEKSYLDLAAGRGVCRPRIDMSIPTSDPSRTYRWGTMEGGAMGGYFAIRMKSDVIHYDVAADGTRTQEKYCAEPGLYCGLIFLTEVETGRPLAILNDGVLQHMRVGGDGGLGVNTWRGRTLKWWACLAVAAWPKPTCGPSWRCATSGNCRSTAPPGPTGKHSVPEWHRNTASRSRSATGRNWSIAVLISSPR